MTVSRMRAVQTAFLVISAAAVVAALSGVLEGRSAPAEFILFALTLMGIALFHHYTLAVGLTGLTTISIYKIIYSGFAAAPGIPGFFAHLHHEWVILANLLCLLMGFALLSRHFEASRVPDLLPDLLPDDWRGGLVLLLLVSCCPRFSTTLRPR